ncbi:S8 family serine peptidase [Paenibacillus turpanensis]|uniref:S8 family serine peptidase n=1 Tax=Paenibacillus turpanensis TaxID=2689078 RepID=UPI001FB7911C|nr:S8 family serine peptidase [Paenibacillus turpanensis]
MQKLLIYVCLFALLSVIAVPAANGAEPHAQRGRANLPDTWIVKWKESVPERFRAESEIVRSYEDRLITVVKPKKGRDPAAWAAYWGQSRETVYMQPNQEVRIQAGVKPNDTYYSKQYHLQQIRAEEAWSEATENPQLIIAVVDTGVDLDHPDLTPNLVKGYNLIDPSEPPEDDNGHGTNVAGVIGAVGNNRLGVTGLLWRTKIMPIKAVEANGRGEEDKLGEGIRYAVDHGAKIVVLSLGLNRYTPYLKEIADYAEKKGVLLVAASGNEGTDVKYPAAYPTVVAVGGVGLDNTADYRSNRGPELDIVAPWFVYTTAKDGGYEYNEGTSMAAPQVAGVAGLIWNKYPYMKPVEIRSLLRQTAEDLTSSGWDAATGYGLLRADLALKEQLMADPFEPNDTKLTAKPLPITNAISAQFADSSDVDWFYFDAPYDGYIQLQYQPAIAESVELTFEGAGTPTAYELKSGGVGKFPVRKGRTQLRLRLMNPTVKAAVPYTLTSSFEMGADPFENNDKKYQAFTLPGRSGVYTGSFHKVSDVDWFAIDFEETGSLQVRVSTNTPRIDPEILIEPQKAEKELLVDQYGEGIEESTPMIDVTPGRYYIRLRNVVSAMPYPVVGEYDLAIEFTPRFFDPNEPNNRAYQAVAVSDGTQYEGVFHNAQDEDWFSFRVPQSMVTDIRLDGVPYEATVGMELINASLKPVGHYVAAGTSGGSVRVRSQLEPGTYYIQLKSDRTFHHQKYTLKVESYPLLSGFMDIGGHWAAPQIQELTQKSVINGKEAYLFLPQSKVTRAEAAAMIVRAFKFTKRSSESFHDVGGDHWAYEVIQKALQAGVVSGYPDGTFLPDQPITRVEMTVMLANALNIRGKIRGPNPFADVTEEWAIPIIKQMNAEGWITGYGDGLFYPKNQATRAEFAALLYRVISGNNR